LEKIQEKFGPVSWRPAAHSQDDANGESGGVVPSMKPTDLWGRDDER
jgi:hypothetical protein